MGPIATIAGFDARGGEPLRRRNSALQDQPGPPFGDFFLSALTMKSVAETDNKGHGYDCREREDRCEDQYIVHL
jgi:hypothetical protein